MLKIINSQIDLEEIANTEDPIEAIIKYMQFSSPPRNKKEGENRRYSLFWAQFLNLLSEVWEDYKWSEEIDQALGQTIDTCDWEQFLIILKSLKKIKVKFAKVVQRLELFSDEEKMAVQFCPFVLRWCL
jgi:hypothetical protein